MQTKQFKAESKRLLDLMINSIYTNKEIFLRELISNASDAIDKLYYNSLTQKDIKDVNRDDFEIKISVDKTARLLTISDNGIGMSAKEMEENLGTIAKSGSLLFKDDNKLEDKAKQEIDIIGQFGVGFYSAFMVSDVVTVTSKAYGNDKANIWQSEGADGYTIGETTMQEHGTKIELKIKENDDDDDYDEFLDGYRLQSIIKKYSDYIRYPIKMEVEKTRIVEDEDNKDESDEDKQPEYETYTEIETVNSMVPIWRRNRSELKDEDYNNFYKDKFFDFEDPVAVIHSSAEGAATYNALMFIPARAPFDYYSKEYEKGLQLYASGVLIMDKCADLLPDHFSFVKGLVDSQDLSLNISREMLQQDRQLKLIATRLEKRIKTELISMQRNDREKYDKFYKNFGLQLKIGVYTDYMQQNRETLEDLLMFYSSTEKKMVTFEEYTKRMPEEQKYIYYASGESVEQLDNLPQSEIIKDKGFEILYCTEQVDEFTLKALGKSDEKEFRSIASSDLGFEAPEQTEKQKEKAEKAKDLFELMTEDLDGKVQEVRLSPRLKTHPVCLTSEGELTLEMEKVLSSMPAQDQNMPAPKATRILEINENHEIFNKLLNLYEADEKEKIANYSKLLYNQALLIEGMQVEDPVEFSNAVSNLMAEK